MARQYTKKGPGRVHAESLKPQRKFPIARKGGWWKGTEYKTQPEIDSETRARLNTRAAEDVQ